MKDLYHDSVFYLKTNTWDSCLNDIEAYDKIKSRSFVGEPELIVLQSWYTALGKGCEKNITFAIELLEQDAVQKSAGALCAAGLGFLRGYYGCPDEDRALYFFNKAEKICVRKANYQKGMMSFNRYLIKRDNLNDLEMARTFFAKAAKSGHATSLSMHVFCRTKPKVVHILKFFSILASYLVSRSNLGGPERWWCYRDLEKYRPTTVKLAEGCGHALGYFAKK
ncbi:MULTISPECIES: sel1 repeat family protein [Halomonadaceae]|uniref:Uncharacterized protein n=1 Tax=Vreelandella titanicae TaxID=664683 RepID=A0AAP9NPB6_9GAMM|nr:MULTISPECIES: sel1 repeat family protein [Halomonas]QKS25661.1 hypothetical protein FX987_03457 [Halomonas titanicae]CDG53142.1 hypothetical protein HALA3H3_470152 [Halomonas sp. A3H3]SDJ47306.1 hypothetical protein SAMN04487867_1552 [Halomonas titanicae]|tara:strand:- start:892 stop:1560 length:669 start_codon:yes stop_codon:yes gene_type:complete